MKHGDLLIKRHSFDQQSSTPFREQGAIHPGRWGPRVLRQSEWWQQQCRQRHNSNNKRQGNSSGCVHIFRSLMIILSWQCCAFLKNLSPAQYRYLATLRKAPRYAHRKLKLIDSLPVIRTIQDEMAERETDYVFSATAYSEWLENAPEPLPSGPFWRVSPESVAVRCCSSCAIACTSTRSLVRERSMA
jgi:hypothetical protein